MLYACCERMYEFNLYEFIIRACPAPARWLMPSPPHGAGEAIPPGVPVGCGEEDEYGAEGEDGEEDKESGDSSAEEDEPIQGGVSIV